MISLGLFEAQVNEVGKMLRQVDLLDGWRNVWRNPSGLAARLRGKSYRDVWTFTYSQQLFDFRLRDFALLQFRRNDDAGELSYAYYDPPFQFMSYEEFIRRELGVEDTDVGEEFREEYENALQISPARETVTPMRYDYDPKGYRRGVHPVSHIHVGTNNQVRIGTRKVFLPLTFGLAVIRQYYPNEWDRLLESPDAKIWCRQIRESLEDIPEKFVHERDAHEHILR